MSRPPPLPRETEIALLAAAQRGDQDALCTLVTANSWIVSTAASRLASKFDSRHLLADLQQEGFVGLTEAIHRFAPEHGTRLSTYATFWVRRRILEFLTASVEEPRLSLDAPVSPPPRYEEESQEGDYPGTLGDVIEDECDAPEDRQVDEELMATVRRHVNDLPLVFRHAIDAYYGISRPPEKMSTIALELGISEQSVSKVLAQAHASLRASMKSVGDA